MFSDLEEQIKYRTAKMQFGIGARIILYEQIMAMVKENIPVRDVLDTLTVVYASENKKDYRSYILQRWSRGIARDGSIVTEAKKWVPESEVIMFETADQTGDWVRCLESLIAQMESQKKISDTLKAKLAYPVFLIFFLFVLVYAFGSKGVPMLINLLPLEKWPESSIPLYNMSTFVSGYPYAIFGGLFALYFVLYSIQTKYVGSLRPYLDNVPPFSIYRSIQGASFLISLSALLRSGVPILDAVKSIDKNGSPWMKSKIKKINHAFGKGSSGADALIAGGKEAMFVKDVRIQVKSFSGLSQLDKSIKTIGLRATDITVKSVEKAAGMISICVFALVAFALVWMYSSFFTVSQMAAQA